MKDKTEIEMISIEIPKHLKEYVENLVAQKQIKRRYKIKYQNPDNPSETWTGLGKYPRWLRDKIKATKNGNNLDHFLVN
jgi:DNA-binding protein H-NS